MENGTTKGLSKLIRIDGSKVRWHLNKMVKGMVQGTLNGLLEAEADEMYTGKAYAALLKNERFKQTFDLLDKPVVPRLKV